MKSRVIFDANSLVSSVLSPDSTNARALFYTVENEIVITSEDCFREFIEVILRKKFDRYFTHEERRTILIEIEKKVRFVAVSSDFKICRDPKDDKYLQLAVDGNADFLITGDQDLLVLNPFHGIRILRPADFLRELEL